MYIDIGEMNAGKQDRPSLIIEGPHKTPQIAKNVNKIHILAHTCTCI